MIYHPPPETHAVYLDHSTTGVPRISVTVARKSKKGSGKRVFHAHRSRARRLCTMPCLTSFTTIQGNGCAP